MVKKENLKTNLKIGSIYKKPPCPSKFFDAVICARIKAIRKAVKEIEWVLKPNGLIFITVSKKKFKKEMAPKDKL